ncbi:MAG TPA: phosphatase PAP2 family protein [Opitutaceae bacterium]|nr:phosphatase PAP2 family protein [Lacunisphaera sp.]HWA08700.1 phosphatase PAP2 family protein [Opitutaceae bacterium]
MRTIVSSSGRPHRPSLGRRLRAHPGLKLGSILLFGAVFFAGYFLLLKFPVFPVRLMPVTALDRMIPFQPGALALYVSLWAYVPLVPGLMGKESEIARFYRTAGGMCLVGFAVFLFCPTAVPPLEAGRAVPGMFERLKEVDGSGNACPSLHVAFAVFCALLLGRELRAAGVRGKVQLANWAWCVGIVYSTLATKQHVALDALAGAALGMAGAFIHLRTGRVAAQVETRARATAPAG